MAKNLVIITILIIMSSERKISPVNNDHSPETTVSQVLTGEVHSTLDTGMPDTFIKVETGESEFHQLVFPKADYFSVLAYTSFSWRDTSTLCNSQKVPVPTEFNYTLSSYENTFLEEAISQTEIQEFCRKLSKALQTSVLEPMKNILAVWEAIKKLSVLLFLAFWVVAVISMLKGYQVLLVVSLVVPVLWVGFVFFFLDPLVYKRFASKASRHLVNLVHQEKAKLWSRGILVRPGNCASFLLFKKLQPPL